jgi:hypothetical protein
VTQPSQELIPEHKNKLVSDREDLHAARAGSYVRRKEEDPVRGPLLPEGAVCHETSLPPRTPDHYVVMSRGSADFVWHGQYMPLFSGEKRPERLMEKFAGPGKDYLACTVHYRTVRVHLHSIRIPALKLLTVDRP